jgi:hypothetical protein
MVKFLNQFSRKCRGHRTEQNEFLSGLFRSFLETCKHLPDSALLNKKTGRFNIALYEASFAATCRQAAVDGRYVKGSVESSRLSQLEEDQDFVKATLEGTTQTKNVILRIKRAQAIMEAL